MKYIVIGSSHWARFIIEELKKIDKEAEIIIVAKSVEIAETLAKTHNVNFVHGHGTLLDEELYEKAGARDATAIIISTESDSLNLRLAELLRERYETPMLICLVNNPLNAEDAIRYGCNHLLDPTTVVVDKIRALLSKDKWVKTYIPLYFGLEIYIYRVFERARLGVTLGMLRSALSDLDVKLIVSNVMLGHIDKSDYKLREGDLIVIITPAGLAKKAIGRVEELFRSLSRGKS